MGLMDILNGMQNGPRGQTQPGKGGMSPMTMAILAMLAYKAYQKMSAGQPGAAPANAPAPGNAGGPGGGLGGALGNILGDGGGASGGLGNILQGGLGGLLAGGAAGSVLSGGLGGLLKQFQQNGQGEIANSWVGTGANRDMSESDMAKSIGMDDIDTLSKHTGLSRDDLLAGLRRELPGAIDELTPDGRVPSGEELSQRV